MSSHPGSAPGHVRALQAELANPWVVVNVALRVVLVVGLLHMVTQTNHHWTDGSKMVRGLAYPVFAALVPFLYVRRALGGAYPIGVDLTFNFVFTSDLVANNLGLYGWYEYKFLVHFSNGVFFTLIILAVLSGLKTADGSTVRASRLVPQALFLMVAGHTVWETYEWLSDAVIGTEYVRRGLVETTADTFCAVAGALLAVALVALLERRRLFSRAFVTPLSDSGCARVGG